MAKIIAASILVLCLIHHVLTLPTTPKGYQPVTHNKKDIVNMCQACEIVVSWLYHQVQEKEAHISPRKDEIVQYSKNICNSSEEEADQISNIDIVERWNECKLVNPTTEGKCNSEGKNIEGACRKVMSFFSKDVDRHKLKSEPQYNLQVQLLCRNLSTACGWKLPPEVNPKFNALRMKGIHPDHEAKLYMMFRDIVATGGITWNPIQGLCIDNNVEATQLGIDDIVRSTDENLEDRVDEILVEPIGTQSRKRASQTSKEQARGKKAKKLSTELGSQTNKLLTVVESRNAATVTSKATNLVGPYEDLIKILDYIPEIVEDEDLYYFAISHLKEKINNRQVFMSLKDDTKKVKYLIYEFRRESSLCK